MEHKQLTAPIVHTERRKSSIQQALLFSTRKDSPQPIPTPKKLSPNRKLKNAVFKLQVVKALSTAKFLSHKEVSVKDIEDGS